MTYVPTIKIVMTGQMPYIPYQEVFWTVYNTVDTFGANSGYGANYLINIGVSSFSVVGNNPLTLNVGGDLSGTLPDPTVVGLQNQPVSSTVPTIAGEVLAWNGSWAPTPLGQGLSYTGGSLTVPIGAGLQFSGGQTVVGQNTDNNILVNSNNIQLSNSQSFSSSFSLTTNVLLLTGTSGIDLTGPITLENGSVLFDIAAVSPSISQINLSTASGIANGLTIQAQNATGTTSNGGSLNLTSGSGTFANGVVNLQTAGSTRAFVNDTTITSLVPTIQYGAAVASPTISQITTPTNSATGQTMTIQAQNASGTTSHGATLLLSSGSGTSSNGNVFLATAGTARVLITDTVVDFTVPTVQFLASVSSPFIMQADNTTNSGAGQNLVIHAQNATGTTSVGGNISIAAGTGTSSNGTTGISGSFVSLIESAGGNTRIKVNGTGIGFFATAPIAQPARATNAPLTAATGSASGTISDVGSSFNQTTLNNNFKSLTTTLNALEAAIHALGLTS